ncbi:uncharacterized protein TNCV_331191 [Trichonephila clavipes]|nr:uncharacterized protein TNCV_331191 [Trichonephila clavipes]
MNKRSKKKCNILSKIIFLVQFGEERLIGLIEYYRRTVQLHEAFWETDHVILNHGQVTWTTPELAPPFLTTTPHGRTFQLSIRLNVHRCPTRRVFSGSGLELVTRQATIRYLYHSATAVTRRRAETIYL